MPVFHRLVLILDHDETIATSEKDATGKYIIQPDGATIKATAINKPKLRRIAEIAATLGIPIHIVTARPESAGNKKVVEGVIDSVDGFRSRTAGFNRNLIHFIYQLGGKDGIERVAKTKRMNGESTPAYSKAQCVEDIHHQYYPDFPKEAFLFVDDMDEYLNEVSKAGYPTLPANPDTLEHFKNIEQFLFSHCHHTYRHQPRMFKIPSEKGELPFNDSTQLSEEAQVALNHIPLRELKFS